MGDAVLAKLLVEVGVGEAALRPVLLGDDVARLRREVGMPFAAPFAAGEGMARHHRLLRRIGVLPVLVVAGFPPAMRRHEDA